MLASSAPTPAQLARERSLQFTINMDWGLGVLIVVVAVVGGSLTLMAEAVRGLLTLSTEVFALIAMRRIHRGQLTELEFGSGKLEQAANLSIAAGMLFGAGWIAWGALHLVIGDRPPPTPGGLAAGAMFAALNLYLNFIGWVSVLQVTPPGSPVIMEAQLRSRAVKVLSSIMVLTMLVIPALSIDPVIATWCDVIGAVFVAIVILVNAAEMIRGGVPDLLDRCANEAMQRGINRALARHFADYDQLHRVRSRRSGKTIFIEVALGFDSQLTIADVDRRIQAIRATLRSEVAEADVSILVSCANPNIPHPRQPEHLNQRQPAH